MEKSTFLLFLVACVSSINMQGQTKLARSRVESRFNTLTGVLSSADSTVYAYDSLLNISEFTTWRTISPTMWQPSSRTTDCRYDSAGNRIGSVYQTFNPQSGWINYINFEATYNSNGQRLTTITERWNGTDWDSKEYSFNVYNQDGYLILQESPYYRTTHILDAQNRRTESITEIFWLQNGNPVWSNYARHVYSYSIGGANNEIITFAYWNMGNWEDESRTTNTFDINGIRVMRLYELYNNLGWEILLRTVFSRDADGNLIETRSENLSNGIWLPSSLVINTYDQYSNSLSEAYLVCADTHWVVENYIRTNYDWFGIPAPSETFEFDIFPNPCADIIQIKGSYLHRAMLYDVAGRLVLQKNMSSDFLSELPVAHLPAGTYQLQVFDQTGRVGVKSVVIGR